jgi:hypothetical protein
MLARDRDIAGKGGHRSKPGLAEFIDLLRAVARRHEGDTTAQLEALDRVRKFTLQKYLHD